MIITFCGHSSFIKSDEHEWKMLSLFKKAADSRPVQLYLGGYGSFDSFSYQCGRKYKEAHPNVTLVLVTPYLTLRSNQNAGYDTVLYPPIEHVPPKFAISYRNRFMVEQADCVIAYIEHSWGGAYQTYQYAKRKGKTIFNLAEL